MARKHATDFGFRSRREMSSLAKPQSISLIYKLSTTDCTRVYLENSTASFYTARVIRFQYETSANERTQCAGKRVK